MKYLAISRNEKNRKGLSPVNYAQKDSSGSIAFR